MTSRPSRDRTLMLSAENWATQATCPRLAVGAVLSRDGREFTQGYNGAPRKLPHCTHGLEEQCRDAVHAEMNAIFSAAYLGVSTLWATLYVTHSPCWECAGGIINCGISQVVFRDLFRDTSGLDRMGAAGVLVRRLHVDD